MDLGLKIDVFALEARGHHSDALFVVAANPSETLLCMSKANEVSLQNQRHFGIK